MEKNENNEVVFYEPDETLKLDVRLENDTVWLTQSQMSELFLRDRSVITKHINNIFKEKELEENSNVHFLHIASSDKPVKFFSLDVIISVGYRVKSVRGTRFRQWANKVLKDYLLRGYAINQRLIELSDRLDRRLLEQDGKIAAIRKDVDFFVRSSIQPKEGILFDGQIFDAYAFVPGLIRKANKRIVVIDSYVDDSVLVQLSKRRLGVKVDIYDGKISQQLRQDVARHNAQYPGVTLHSYKKAHDRFLIIDEEVYHIGHSLKDLGKKLFAFSKMEVMTGSQLIAAL